MGPLLARGRDRLETELQQQRQLNLCHLPYSLGDAIDWKRGVVLGTQ